MNQEEKRQPEKNLVVGVRFRPVGKVYHFDASQFPGLKTGDHVVVDTARGKQLGQVASLTTPDDESVPNALKTIERRASGRDLAVRQYWENREGKVLEAARAYVRQEELPIKVIRAEYSFDGKKLTCFFYVEGQSKVKTQSLQRYLRKTFRVSVNLRQIGPRDAAKGLEGMGACGKVRCCVEFIVNFTPISIRMAKTQGVSLSPSEITGMCGRLRCCLKYEQDQYKSALQGLPKKGKRVATPYGEGKVINLLPLQETAVIMVRNQQIQVHRDHIYSLEEWKEMEARGELPSLPATETPPPIIPEIPALEKQKDKSSSKRSRSRKRRKRRSSGRRSSKSKKEADKQKSTRDGKNKDRRRGRRKPRKK